MVDAGDADRYSRFLGYFALEVLSKYKGSPEKYTVWERAFRGEVALTDTYREQLSLEDPVDHAFLHVRFGRRRLMRGGTCIAALKYDLAQLPEREKHYWYSFELPSPEFADHDPHFEQFAQSCLGGDWLESADPLDRVADALDLINRVFPHGRPLFRHVENPALTYPAANNERAYVDAHIELYRLVAEGMDKRALKWLAGNLGTDLDPQHNSVTQLASLLPEQAEATIIEPMRRCIEVRRRTHGIRDVQLADRDYEQIFRNEVEAVAEGLEKLLGWVQQTLGGDARHLRRRQDRMKSFPQLLPPRVPLDGTTDQLARCVGRTVKAVDFGAEESRPDCHEREAIIIHFTDGSAMCIRIFLNAQDFSDRGIEPNELDASLFVSCSD